MSRRGVAWGLIAAGVVGAGLGYALLGPGGSASPAGDAARVGVTAAPIAPGASAANGSNGDGGAQDRAAPPGRLGSPAHRSLPRPVRSPSAAPTPRVRDLAGVTDRRGPNATGNIDAAALTAGFEAMDADIDECVTQWLAVDPTMGGRVEIGFDIGPDGLTDAWIADRQDLPDGPLTCFGAAVYAVDWSGVTDKPVEITRPYTVSPDGPAGAAVQ